MKMKYQPRYNESRALIIGINEYQHTMPLSYATSDAVAIAKVLEEQYSFKQENVTILKDDKATKNNVLDAFHKYTQGGTSPDDKLIVFFAGHGHTISGIRGETGFLVPVDGKPDNTATLIRWDELTRNTDLINAKHIFFIMDACYGGLAITRALQTGTTRFLKDMCQRIARQVLTAGKANEAVSDSGGPIPGHSVFTGHLIQALEGNAKTEDGIITANGVMGYVYNKVSTDQYSRQTPHYGFIDGDGDFIFKADVLEELAKNEEKDNDILISVPATFIDGKTENKDLIEKTKEYIADDRYRIKLDDLIVQEIRKVLDLTSQDHFPLNINNITTDDIVSRLSKYEEILKPLRGIVTVLCYWGDEKHRPLIQKIISRLAERNIAQSGTTVLINLRWYPICLLFYTGGLASVASEKYKNLASLFMTEGPDIEDRRKTKSVILSMCNEMTDLNDTFKKIPGHEKNYVPRSEYIFKTLQPGLEDIIFLGNSYEHLFDIYELLQMFVYADLEDCEWGPFGRFGWKHSQKRDTLVKDYIEDAKKQGSKWPPIQAGLFKSDINRFNEISGFLLPKLDQMHWW
jgi:hypothetical protein